MTEELAIKDVAEATGVAAGTIRQWESRYGFPEPRRTASGYRRYSQEDVAAIRAVVAHRHRGLSVQAAIERATATGAAEHPSIYATVASATPHLRPLVLTKRTLVRLSRAIEHECLAHAAASVLFGAFQREEFYRQVEPRYRRMAERADAAMVFADFPELGRPDGAPVEIPITAREALGNEWAVIVDSPAFAACLLAWEQPGVTEPGSSRDLSRRFECIWTADPVVVRRAASTAARLAARADPDHAAEVEDLLRDRPLAEHAPATQVEALTNRMIGYLDAPAP